MPKKVLFVLFLLLFSLIAIRYALNPDRTQAVISSCSVSVNPDFQNSDSSGTLSFGVTNNDESGNSIRWIRITAPSSNFVITDGTGLYKSAIEINGSGSEITIRLTGLSPGEYGEYYISVTTSQNVMPAMPFGVQVSDTDTGDNPVGCSGDTGVSIISVGQEIINISNLSVSFTDTSAVINWNTDSDATSQVDYGTTNQYGSTVTDLNLATTHAVSLTGLSSSTVYHFRVTSANADNDIAQLTDNTFTTALAGVTTTTTVTVSSTTETSSKDSTAPTLSLSTNLSKAYLTAPTVSGSASDNSGVSGVEYSTDGGRSWIAASVKGKGGKQVTFSFSLGVLDDGNYTFSIRAKDAGGNVSETKSYTLIIDRLPPQIGTTIFSAGPQVFAPTKEGVLVTVSGLEQKITLSAIGGPISLEISAGDKKFNLTKNPESGLWSGTIKFDNPGPYQLTSKSVDGAKNETIQALAKVFVQEAGKVSYLGKPISGAEVSVYFFEPTLGQFILWDGVSYGQSNPQKTNENGNYSLFLPSGRYYLEAKLSGFIKLRTQIFELSAPSVINADLSGRFLSIPFIANEIKIDPRKDFPVDVKIEGELVGKDFPLTQVAEVTGVELVSGKPQVVSFLSTWLPDTAEQIKILESLPQEELAATVIFPQESKPAVEIFAKRGRYNLTLLADPDGKLVEPLLLRFLPTHFFLDKDAKIKMIRFGVLNQEELLKNAR